MSNLWESSFCIAMLSLTPLSKTLWLPSGMPALARRSRASLTSAVSSRGWLA